MANEGLNFKGYAEFVKKTKEIVHDLPACKERIALETGLYGERAIKMRTPVRYGRLRASIGHYTPGVLKDGGNGSCAADAFYQEEISPTVITIYIGTNVIYAAYVEWGTEKFAGRQMFQLGIADTERVFDRIQQKHFKRLGFND